jgi:hypothetical protein
MNTDKRDSNGFKGFVLNIFIQESVFIRVYLWLKIVFKQPLKVFSANQGQNLQGIPVYVTFFSEENL